MKTEFFGIGLELQLFWSRENIYFEIIQNGGKSNRGL